MFGLYDYIEGRAGAVTAGGYLDRIEALCLSLGTLPGRGVDRSDLGPSIRTVTLERRVMAVYRATAEGVQILRVLYAGRDFGAEDLPK